MGEIPWVQMIAGGSISAFLLCVGLVIHATLKLRLARSTEDVADQELEALQHARVEAARARESADDRIQMALVLDARLKDRLDLEAEVQRVRAENERLRAIHAVLRSIAVAAQAVLAESPATKDSAPLAALRRTLGSNYFVEEIRP